MFLLFNFWHKVFPGKNYNPTLVKQTVKLLKKTTDEYPPSLRICYLSGPNALISINEYKIIGRYPLIPQNILFNIINIRTQKINP